jgi:ornithine cyclodeaminase/alanine dehydrogenase-like protein (mu-crystallin family)
MEVGCNPAATVGVGIGINAPVAGLIDDDHIVAEIGEVLAGKAVGRRAVDEITV